jgi:hypothetical protein
MLLVFDSFQNSYFFTNKPKELTKTSTGFYYFFLLNL